MSGLNTLFFIYNCNIMVFDGPTSSGDVKGERGAGNRYCAVRLISILPTRSERSTFFNINFFSSPVSYTTSELCNSCRQHHHRLIYRFRAHLFFFIVRFTCDYKKRVFFFFLNNLHPYLSLRCLTLLAGHRPLILLSVLCSKYPN